MNEKPSSLRLWMRAAMALAAAGSLIATPALAQVGTVDPNSQIDADLVPGAPASANAATEAAPAQTGSTYSAETPVTTNTAAATPDGTATSSANSTATANTYKQDDLIGAAEGVFGKGAAGLAGIIEKTLKEQGEPVAYITGREASGAIGVGLRYGSGTMFHKVEGQRDVYWTGPSIGFDLGGNAANTFVLVYNLYDTQNLYKRYPAGEGAAYFVGGFNASYLRWKDVVLIPIRLGVGYRLGVNAGYMKFSEKRTWLPF
jgi:hypothetical protein